MSKVRWPTKRQLKEAIKTFEDFRTACQYQLDVGLWMTVDFPSKHQVNKILSVQYRKIDVLEKEYGKGLAYKALEIVPQCKAYTTFLRDDTKGKND